MKIQTQLQRPPRTRRTLPTPENGPTDTVTVGTLAREALPAITGLALGAPAAKLGMELAKNYRQAIVRSALRGGSTLALHPETGLKALSYLQDVTFVSRVGAVTFGLAGFALGAALFWPTRDQS